MHTKNKSIIFKNSLYGTLSSTELRGFVNISNIGGDLNSNRYIYIYIGNVANVAGGSVKDFITPPGLGEIQGERT